MKTYNLYQAGGQDATNLIIGERIVEHSRAQSRVDQQKGGNAPTDTCSDVGRILVGQRLLESGALGYKWGPFGAPIG